MFGFYGPGSGEEGLGVRVYGSGQHCDSTELSKVCIFIYIYIYIFFFFLGGGAACTHLFSLLNSNSAGTMRSPGNCAQC